MRPYTLKQIQTFLEVARQGSVSKAAERLFVTQPAVSMQIRQLEDAFGLPLVEPVGRNIRLTHAGEAFRTHAIAAMGQFKDLEALMADHVGLKRGRIDLAVVSTAKYFIPMLLVRFAKLYPGVDITLSIDNRENILGRLARNEVDLLLRDERRVPRPVCRGQPFEDLLLDLVGELVRVLVLVQLHRMGILCEMILGEAQDLRTDERFHRCFLRIAIDAAWPAIPSARARCSLPRSFTAIATKPFGKTAA